MAILKKLSEAKIETIDLILGEKFLKVFHELENEMWY
jgi:hypothetical protein